MTSPEKLPGRHWLEAQAAFLQGRDSSSLGVSRREPAEPRVGWGLRRRWVFQVPGATGATARKWESRVWASSSGGLSRPRVQSCQKA